MGIHVQQNTNDKMKANLNLPFVHKPRKTLIEPIIAKRIAESIEKSVQKMSRKDLQHIELISKIVAVESKEKSASKSFKRRFKYC